MLLGLTSVMMTSMMVVRVIAMMTPIMTVIMTAMNIAIMTAVNIAIVRRGTMYGRWWNMDCGLMYDRMYAWFYGLIYHWLPT